MKRRFGFGKNWANFLKRLNDPHIREAEKSMRVFLDCTDLQGKEVLDIGSGSGLFSLAAMRLAAERVFSFDYDSTSVACAQTLRDRYFPAAAHWTVQQGSALDDGYMSGLGQFDIVYSWGVLHHTGDMWKALALAADRVKPGGKLYISIYNDQGMKSRFWLSFKRLYNQVPWFIQPVLVIVCGVITWSSTFVRDLLKYGNPLQSWWAYSDNRGMSAWYDLIDWAGGYPFQVAKPEEISRFFQARGFVMQRQVTCGKGYGCNEFLFTLRS